MDHIIHDARTFGGTQTRYRLDFGADSCCSHTAWISGAALRCTSYVTPCCSFKYSHLPISCSSSVPGMMLKVHKSLGGSFFLVVVRLACRVSAVVLSLISMMVIWDCARGTAFVTCQHVKFSGDQGLQFRGNVT